MKKIVFLTLLGLFTLPNSSCDRCIQQVLAELGIKIVASTATTIFVGNPFSVTSLIKNSLDGVKGALDCWELEKANKSKTRLETAFDEDGEGDDWKSQSDTSFSENAFEKDESVEHEDALTLNKVGFYRIKYWADDKEDVNEHLEDNNDSNPTVTRVRSSSANEDMNFDDEGYLIVRVIERYPGDAERFKNLPSVQVTRKK